MPPHEPSSPRLTGITHSKGAWDRKPSAGPPQPFKIAREEFDRRIKTISLARILVPRDLEPADAIRGQFESMIAARLRQAGFTVIQSQDTVEIWERITQKMGGYFDPMSGTRDEKKLALIRDDFGRELSEKFKTDAILFPALIVVRAPWSGGSASWHGTSESVKSTGTRVAEAFSGFSTRGTVGALSLNVRIEDVNGVLIYQNVGGIQVLSKVGFGLKFAAVPRSDLLMNDERDAKPVEIALTPLLTRAQEAGTTP